MPGRRHRPDTRLNLLSEETMRNLLDFLEYLDRKTVSQCQDMVMLWFDEPAARQIVQDHLDAVKLGRIRRDPKSPDQRPTFDLFVKREDSDVEPGARPGEVDGFLFWLGREFRRQASLVQDKLREKGQDLDVQGNRKANVRPPRNLFRAFATDVFIADLRPGETVLITGPKGSGKTDFAVNHIIAPALAAGMVVVSNIKIFEPRESPMRELFRENYKRVLSMDAAIVYAVRAKKAKKRAIVVIDEGTINRGRSNAQRRENKVLKDNSTWARKFGFPEVYIYQRDEDVARELEDWAIGYFRKVSQTELTRVYCDTPLLKGITIDDLPTTAWLKENGRPYLEFDTDDPATYEANVDIANLVRAVFSTPSKDGSFDHPDWMDEVLARVEDAMRGPSIDEPMNFKQLHWLCCALHRRDNQMKPIAMVHMLLPHFAANGYKDPQDARALIVDQWEIVSHPNDIGRWCTYCHKTRGGRPTPEAGDEPSNPVPAAPLEYMNWIGQTRSPI